MFTKIAKAALWLSILGGIIASIAIGSMDEGWGWFIPVGIISTFVIASGFGMLIEIAENIQESREHLYEIRSKMGGAYGANSSNAANGAPQNYGNKNYANAAARLSAIANGGTPEPVPDFWYCRSCGEKNDKLASSCKGCGKYK